MFAARRIKAAGALGNLDFYACPVDIENMATVQLTSEAAEQIESLPEAIHRRVRAILKRLENWPAVSGVKRLSGNLAGWYRVRTGDYRIRFRIEGKTIIVDKIGHRRDVYED